MLEKEVIFKEDLEAIFGPRPFDEEKTVDVAVEEEKKEETAPANDTTEKES